MSDSQINLILGVFIGILAYTMQNIGKGIQKYAIEGFKEQKTIKTKHSGYWIIGTILTSLFVFVQWIPLALFHTPMNLIAPLEGIGLISLILFSYFVLKEKMRIFEFFGILLIIFGTVIINLNVMISGELLLVNLHLAEFWLILIIISLFSIIFYFVFKKKSHFFNGIILSLIAGCCMAFQTLSKRITDINELIIIFTFVTFFFAIITLVFSQLAFAKTNANIVVPCFTSTSIIMTILLGVFVIEEAITTIQYFGVGCIIIGVILLTGFKKEITNQKYNTK